MERRIIWGLVAVLLCSCVLALPVPLPFEVLAVRDGSLIYQYRVEGEPMNASYRSFVHVLDDVGSIVYNDDHWLREMVGIETSAAEFLGLVAYNRSIPLSALPSGVLRVVTGFYELTGGAAGNRVPLDGSFAGDIGGLRYQVAVWDGSLLARLVRPLPAVFSKSSVSQGDVLEYTLNFDARPTGRSLRVFVHFIDDAGNIVLNDDHWPKDVLGFSSDDARFSGSVSYSRRVVVPAFSGRLRVVVGMYGLAGDAAGERVLLESSSAPDMGEYRYLVGGVFAGGVEGAALSFEEGELIKNRDGSEVYLVKGAKLRHLKDEDAYRFFVNRCFIRFDREVSKSGLDGFGEYGEQLVAPSSYTQCPAEGALVMSICLPNVYLFEGGKFRWVEDEYTFRNKGYRFSDVNVISERLIPTPYGPSVCGGLGGPIKVQNPADPVPDTARHRALLDFGFGQAVVMNGVPNVDLFGAPDLALTVPGAANYQNAKQNIQYHVPFGKAGTLLYNTAPQGMVDLLHKQDFWQSAGNLNEYLAVAGLPLFDGSDFAGLYPNWDYVFGDGGRQRYLHLGQESTKKKAVNLLVRELAEHAGASGVFVDNVDASAAVDFAYPARLHDALRAFISASPSGPVVGGNLYSLRAHAKDNYAVVDPSIFDVVMVEEFGFNGDSVLDVVAFHRKFPNTKVIVNARYTQPSVSPFGAKGDAEETKFAKGAVVAAALVGGFHAIDGGAQRHGSNLFAHLYLNRPFFQAGLPMTDVQETDVYVKREYKDMVAVYAKSAGDVYVRGRWVDYFTGVLYENGLPVRAGESYLLFRESVMGAVGAAVVVSEPRVGNGSVFLSWEDNASRFFDVRVSDNALFNGSVDLRTEEKSVVLPFAGVMYVQVKGDLSPWSEVVVVGVQEEEGEAAAGVLPIGDGSSCQSPRGLVEGREERNAVSAQGESVWFQFVANGSQIVYFTLKGLQFGRFSMEVYSDCAGTPAPVRKWRDDYERRSYQVSPARGVYYVRVVKEAYDNPPKEFSLSVSSAPLDSETDLEVLDFWVVRKDFANESNVLEVVLRNNGRPLEQQVNVAALENGSVAGWATVYGMKKGEVRRFPLVVMSSAGVKVITVGNGPAGYGWQSATNDPVNGNDNRTKLVRFEEPRRDVAVSSLRVAGPVPYESSVVSFVVSNEGNMAESFFVSSSQIVGGGGKGSFHYSMLPGERVAVSYPWIFYEKGNHSVFAEVDVRDEIAEVDELNNRAEISVYWNYPVDLKVAFGAGRCVDGVSFVPVAVQNVYGADIFGSFTVSTLIDGVLAREEVASGAFVFNATFAAGVHNVTVMADSFDAVDEVDERNNMVTGEVAGCAVVNESGFGGQAANESVVLWVNETVVQVETGQEANESGVLLANETSGHGVNESEWSNGTALNEAGALVSGGETEAAVLEVYFAGSSSAGFSGGGGSRRAVQPAVGDSSEEKSVREVSSVMFGAFGAQGVQSGVEGDVPALKPGSVSFSVSTRQGEGGVPVQSSVVAVAEGVFVSSFSERPFSSAAVLLVTVVVGLLAVKWAGWE